MCVVSMVMDQGIDELRKWQSNPPLLPIPDPSVEQKLDRIISLLEKMMAQAAEYDKETGQPDCEHADKKRTLQELADQLNVTIEFPGEQ